MTTSRVMVRLRSGKSSLREARRSASLPEKLRQLVHAQHLYVQVAGSRRTLKPWQKPWNILSDVQDSIVIGEDSIDVLRHKSTTGSSRSDWVRPKLPWVLSR